MLAYKRGRGKYQTDYHSDDFYNYYKSISKKPVSKKVFMEILKDIYGEVMKMILYEGSDVMLPHGMGSMRIQQQKINLKFGDDGKLKTRLAVDWKATKALWEEKYPGLTSEEISKIPNKPVIRLINEHTDMYRYRWYWDKVTCTIKNQSLYRYKATTTYRDMAAKAFKTIPNLNYYE